MASNQAQKPVAPAGGQDQIVIGSINLDNIQGDIV